MLLYHGSPNIIQHPTYGVGKIDNDFGQGFYCTENPDLACEWAVTPNRDGYCNTYQLDTTNLTTLHFNHPNYNILNWVAFLAHNRQYADLTGVTISNHTYLIENFLIDTTGYDIITGYRADDAYYRQTKAFLRNQLTLEKLNTTLYLGNLGEQIVLKTPQTFQQLHFQHATPAPSHIYYPLRQARTQAANTTYDKLFMAPTPGLLLSDIVNQRIRGDDERIPRNVAT